MTQILVYSDLLGWPEEWTTRNYNACNEPCDMLVGPCACGASHYPEDWADVLRFYNAEIRHEPKTPEAPQLTLSYF